MKRNISKCKVLSLCRNSNNIIKYDYGIVLSDQSSVLLQHQYIIKDLGVLIDSNLSFDEHIHDKINVANKMLGIIRRNFVDLDKNSFILLYKSLVRSHLEYAGSVWNPYKKGLIRDIEAIQKRATKLIRNCKSMEYTNRLKWLELPTLKYRRFRGDMLELYKILNLIY
jgi:ribonuclease P/MRP protein subunit RPP40